MKTLWIALLLLGTLSACLPKKADKQVDPQPQQPELAGTYQITNLNISGTTYIPRQGISGQLNVRKDSDTQLTLTLSVTEQGVPDSKPLGAVAIQKGTGNEYKMVNGNGVSLGTLNGNSFLLDIMNLYIAARK